MSGNDYYGHLRTDVIALLPPDAVDILSLGCGGGRTEAELISRGKKVVGIEPFEPAAQAAAARGVEVIVGDAESSLPALEGRSFDCLIYADVLEHIQDPESVLRAHLKHLRPNGSVVISVPNFRHHSVFRALFIKGIPPYTDAGIFDRTHVRLTTRRLIEQWGHDTGLVVSERRYALWRRRDRLISAATAGLLKEFIAQQVLVRMVRTS